MTLRIGVNLLWLVPGEVGGSEEYVCRLLEGVDEIASSGVELTLFANRRFWGAHPTLANAHRLEVAAISGRSRAARIVTESTWLAARVSDLDLDLVHHPGGTVPIRISTPVLLSLHDLQYLAYPEFFSSMKRSYLRAAMPRSTAQASVVTAPSEFVRGTVVEHLGVPPERVVVVPHGIPSSEPGWGTPPEVVRARYAVPGPFLLYPAVTWAHKNHITVVRALGELRAEHPDLMLVLTGAAGPAEAAVLEEVDRLGLSDRVRRTGRVPAVDINGLYDEAVATVIPSRYEGFGIPALEAMRRGCPVIAARATALPEVVGDGGALVDPDDVGDWVAAIDGVLTDPQRREALVTAGRSPRRTVQRRACRDRPSGRVPSRGGGEPQVKLVVVCPHFAPDVAPTGEVITRIVEQLAGRGHRIEVITALPWYEHHSVEPEFHGKAVRSEQMSWGRITRVHPFPTDKRDIPRRALAFGGFGALVGGVGLVGGRVDGVLALSPPLTLGLTGWGIAVARRAPFVFNIHDVFPDVAIELGVIKGEHVIAAARWLERVTYARADAITVLADDMRDNVLAKVKPQDAAKVRVIPNFVDTAWITPQPRDNEYRRELGLEGKTVVMYAGNIGMSQSLELMLAAATALAHDPEIAFVINGGGAARPGLEVAARGLPNVHFVDLQPKSRLPEVLAAADIHVVPLKRGLGRSSVPSKTYSILAAGRPVLASVDRDTEVERIVERSGAGVAVPPDDPEAFTKALGAMVAAPEELARMGAAGRRFVEGWASPAAIAEQYEGLFEELAADHR